MLKKHLKFNIVFAVFFLLRIIAECTILTNLQYITRLCIPILLSIILGVSTHLKGRFHKRLFTGLIFYIAGDVLLINPSWFAYVLTAFAFAHFFYIRAFYLDFSSAPELDKRGARIAIVLVAIFSISFFFYLRPYLGIMELPVLIGTLIISLLVMMASFRHQRVNDLSFKLIMYGAVLLLLSDALLAYNKFVNPSDVTGLIAISSYIVAQFLMITGGAERKLVSIEA